MKLVLLSVLAIAGCTEHRDHGLTGTQSISVTLVNPPSGGSIEDRLSINDRAIIVNLEAHDADGELDPTFSRTLKVYAQFLGTLTPSLGRGQITEIQMRDGVAMNQTINVPPSVFGSATLWFDDGEGLGAEYIPGRVAGTSPTLWYPDPFIKDLQTPRDEMGLDALTGTPLQDKQVAVRSSRYGEVGRMVITSVFSQGYTVADVECRDATGKPPCTAKAYDHALVFTFSAGRGSDGHVLEEGETITAFAGGLTEFNGLTELSFPRTFTPPFKDDDGDGKNDNILKTREPDPVPMSVDWFKGLSVPEGRINFERNEAGPIQINNGVVCPLDEQYEQYKQWKLDPSGVGSAAICNGDDVISVITSGVVSALDPATLVGKTIPRVVGILRPVSIGSFNVWIIYPRGASDLTLPPPQ